MRMYLISDNIDTYTGMRLSGVEGVVVHEREELEEALKTEPEDTAVCGDPGQARKRQKQEFYYGLCQSGNRAETVNGGWMHGDQ